jgi:hypothetical protein
VLSANFPGSTWRDHQMARRFHAATAVVAATLASHTRHNAAKMMPLMYAQAVRAVLSGAVAVVVVVSALAVRLAT